MYFFFNDTATTEIYTLSLHDALPILPTTLEVLDSVRRAISRKQIDDVDALKAAIKNQLLEILRESEKQGVSSEEDRKSTRLNSSHANISYAVFCLKKKNKFLAIL